MPSDARPQHVDSPDAAGPANLQPDGRADKPLGRGLEDVSHLFLSQKMSDAAARETAASRPPVGPFPQPDIRPDSVLVRSRRTVAKDRLVAALKEHDGALEEGMRGIDTGVPCEACDDIDVMALDRANQLTIIDIDTTPNDGLFLRGIGHVDWVVRNVASLRRQYRGQVINFSQPPRLVLVAPAFSPLVVSAARQISRPQVSLVKYHVADVSGGTGILFEQLEEESGR